MFTKKLKVILLVNCMLRNKTYYLVLKDINGLDTLLSYQKIFFEEENTEVIANFYDLLMKEIGLDVTNVKISSNIYSIKSCQNTICLIQEVSIGILTKLVLSKKYVGYYWSDLDGISRLFAEKNPEINSYIKNKSQSGKSEDN
jgi:hypothetical protein